MEEGERNAILNSNNVHGFIKNLGEALIENMKRGGAFKYMRFYLDARRIKRQFKNERKDSK